MHPYRQVPIPNFGRVCTIDLTNYLERIIIPEYKKWIPLDFLKGGSWDIAYKKEPRILYLNNGSTIEFMSYDQDLEKFGGSSRHWVHEDEECPSDRHWENMMRLVDTDGSCWLTMTPLKGMTWVYSDIYEAKPDHPSIWSIVVDIMDNPHLSKKAIDEILSTFPEDELDARKHGRFIKLSGLVYRVFQRATHVLPFRPPPVHWPRIIGIDPHPRKATAVIWITLDENGNHYVYDELKDDKLDRISAVANEIKRREGRDRVRVRVIDSSANTNDPVHGINVRREFERHGIRCMVATKDVHPGLDYVRELLTPKPMYGDENNLKPRLYIMDNCVHTIREIEHYVYDEYRGPNPDHVDVKPLPMKKNDDLMDAMRYALMTRPSYDPPRVYIPPRKTVDATTGY